MKINIRTKVLLGILFLFVEFVVIGTLSMYYISTLKYSSEIIIKNNCWSVQYAGNMIQALEETQTATNLLLLNKQYQYDENSLSDSFVKFEENLNKEQKNITEFGEKEVVVSITQKYNKYKSLVSLLSKGGIGDKSAYYTVNILPVVSDLRSHVVSLSALNMHAIFQKNENLNEKVKHIYKIISLVLAFCFMISFSFLINFPNYIAGPIKEITKRVKEIANNNFTDRIRISSNDEFKELGEAINSLAEKLELNYTPPVVVELPKVNLNENLVLQNVQLLLGSIRPLLESIAKTESNEVLQKQSEAIKEIENELLKVIEK